MSSVYHESRNNNLLLRNEHVWSQELDSIAIIV
jgi:hypothetical protein